MPTFAPGFPTMSSVSDSWLMFEAKLDKPGIVAFMARPVDDPIPTVVEVRTRCPPVNVYRTVGCWDVAPDVWPVCPAGGCCFRSWVLPQTACRRKAVACSPTRKAASSSLRLRKG